MGMETRRHAASPELKPISSRWISGIISRDLARLTGLRAPPAAFSSGWYEIASRSAHGGWGMHQAVLPVSHRCILADAESPFVPSQQPGLWSPVLCLLDGEESA